MTFSSIITIIDNANFVSTEIIEENQRTMLR